MATKYKLQDIAQLQNKGVFIDANVLIYLFWPTGSHRWEQSYAQVFKRILRQKNPLFIDFSVVSEIINRVLRIEHSKLQPSSKFKDFRNSPEGIKTLSDIYLLVKTSVLPHFSIIGKIFSKKEIEQLLIIDNLDFVDKSTAEICKDNSLVLLTNDQDFKNTDLDILTGNPNILNP